MDEFDQVMLSEKAKERAVCKIGLALHNLDKKNSEMLTKGIERLRAGEIKVSTIMKWAKDKHEIDLPNSSIVAHRDERCSCVA